MTDGLLLVSKTLKYLREKMVFHFFLIQGLCGTFNENQRDDMTTPEGDVEQSVAAFANSWKTKEVCQDASVDLEPTHPCELNGHVKAQTERQCAKIKDAIFERTIRFLLL